MGKCKDKDCEYKSFLMWLSKKKGTLYFEKTVSKLELTTIIVEDVMASSPSFWSAVELFRRKWKARSRKR